MVKGKNSSVNALEGAGGNLQLRGLPGPFLTGASGTLLASYSDSASMMNSVGARQSWLGPVAVIAAILLTALAAGAQSEKVYITEFMAANVRTLMDRDREYSDWIELYNAGGAPATLDGWFLTDDRKDLKKWRFPSVSVGPNEFLVVFASGKDRRLPNAELHTNFKLDAEKGYLALVRADGKTLASEFGASYPQQVAGTTFGLEMGDRSAPVITATSPKRVIVPTGDIGMKWTTAEFGDEAWMPLTETVGFSEDGATGPSRNLRDRMQGKNASAYIRIPFEVSDPAFETLKLRLQYDDGFIAYLNGSEVARRNAPQKAQWNSVATASRGGRAPRVLEEKFDAPSASYVTSQLDPLAKPKQVGLGDGSGTGLLRLINGRFSNQVASIAFPAVAPGLASSVVADFDFRWKGSGEGTERLVFLLLPVVQYGATGAGIDLASLRESKDPKFANAFALQLLFSPEAGQSAVTLHWDRVKRITKDLPSGAFGQRTFHHAQVRLTFTEQGALVDVLLTADGRSGKRGTTTAVSQLLIPGMKPFQPRVQFAGRIGHWDQTIDLDNVRVEFGGNGANASEEFDLAQHIQTLKRGRNVLAIHGLNQKSDDSSFLIAPELLAGYSAIRPNEVRYFPVPTPRAANRPGFRTLSPPPVFSRRGGVFAESVKVELSARIGVVRYTLDGSEPTESSESYSQPIALNASTLIKAKTFAPDSLPSATVTETFTFPDESTANFTSNLPLLVINPFGQYISEGRRTTVSVRFIDSTKGRSALTGTADFDGRASVNIRGFSTLRQPKNSMTLRLKDENDDKVKAPLLGLPKESDWVLYAPYSDKTLMRDVLAYELSNQMGRYAPRTRFVEVFIDRSGGKLGMRDYMGVYVLVERIKRGKNRVNIAALTPADSTEPNISGGYIFKRDHSERYEASFRAGRNHYYYVDPKPEDMSRDQMNWLTRYMSRFEQALYGSEFADPARGYAAFLDVDAFIDQHWLIEMSKNIDGFRYSAYLHKDRGGKLQMGPAWDWNLSFGNADYHEGSDPTGWYTPLLRDSELCWFRRLSEDPEFMQRAIDRWGALRRTVFDSARILARVDELAAQLEQAQARNFRRWPIMGRRVNPNDFVGDTYAEEIKWMKQWIQRRLAWMDGQFLAAPSVVGPIASGSPVTLRASSGKIYYTTDGTDPRLAGGAPSSKARSYSAPVPLPASGAIIARAQKGSNWSSPVRVVADAGSRPRASM